MKRNGQALVEFIIVLPVLIVILLGIVDFGLIFVHKNSLENNLKEVTDIWKDTKSLEEVNLYLERIDEDIKFTIEENDELSELFLETNYNVATPGLNLVLGNPYKIKVSRVIYNG